MEKFKRRFYDSHPKLPLDPDTDHLKSIRPIHTDGAHIAIVGFGAFFGTLARYNIGEWLPNSIDEWPTATLIINVTGAFLLGVLLQALLHSGPDEGGRRMLRLMLGTGFMGAFTTYSSLATSIVLLIRSEELTLAIAYAVLSVVLGVVAVALGIKLATVYYKKKKARKA
jgi:CrcB protein